MQKLGNTPRPMAYFLRHQTLGSWMSGWPTSSGSQCLMNKESHQADLRATFKSQKPTSGSNCSFSQLPPSSFEKYSNPKPTTLPPEVDPENEDFLHSGVETIEQAFSSRPDLKDIALDNPHVEGLADGGCSVDQGRSRAGFAIVSLQEATEAKPLPSGASSQKAQLLALTQALEQEKMEELAFTQTPDRPSLFCMLRLSSGNRGDY